jgi:hypothetical protein
MLLRMLLMMIVIFEIKRHPHFSFSTLSISTSAVSREPLFFPSHARLCNIHFTSSPTTIHLIGIAIAIPTRQTRRSTEIHRAFLWSSSIWTRDGCTDGAGRHYGIFRRGLYAGCGTWCWYPGMLLLLRIKRLLLLLIELLLLMILRKRACLALNGHLALGRRWCSYGMGVTPDGGTWHPWPSTLSVAGSYLLFPVEAVWNDSGRLMLFRGGQTKNGIKPRERKRVKSEHGCQSVV